MANKAVSIKKARGSARPQAVHIVHGTACGTSVIEIALRRLEIHFSLATYHPCKSVADIQTAGMICAEALPRTCHIAVC